MAFLFESYKPRFWWFEIFETARRLAMTGVLGAISPGSDVQLASGIVMTVMGTMVYCTCLPFIDLKDNVLGVLTNLQIFLVMLTAMVMKHNPKGVGEEGVGALLIVLNALCVIVFVTFGLAQAYAYKVDYNEDSKSGTGLAMGVLKSASSSSSTACDDEEKGRGSSLFGFLSPRERAERKEAKRKAFEATAPGWTGEVEEPPPPPPGVPPPNNDIFDKLRLQREADAKAGVGGGIELMENPMRKNGM
jgi:hypothetical protein